MAPLADFELILTLWLKLEGVDAKYDSFKALDGISMSVEPGELVFERLLHRGYGCVFAGCDR